MRRKSVCCNGVYGSIKGENTESTYTSMELTFGAQFCLSSLVEQPMLKYMKAIYNCQARRHDFCQEVVIQHLYFNTFTKK